MRRCSGCNAEFPVSPRERNARKWCSDTCRLRAYRAANPEAIRATARKSHRTNYTPVDHILACRTCTTSFVSRYSGKGFCSDACRYRHDYLSRRARHVKTNREPYSLSQVLDKSGAMCGICNESIDMALKYPSPDCASIDHIIALSRGGADTLDNVQMSHLSCNWSKGNRAINTA